MGPGCRVSISAVFLSAVNIVFATLVVDMQTGVGAFPKHVTHIGSYQATAAGDPTACFGLDDSIATKGVSLSDVSEKAKRAMHQQNKIRDNVQSALTCITAMAEDNPVGCAGGGLDAYQ